MTNRRDQMPLDHSFGKLFDDVKSSKSSVLFFFYHAINVMLTGLHTSCGTHIPLIIINIWSIFFIKTNGPTVRKVLNLILNYYFILDILGGWGTRKKLHFSQYSFILFSIYILRISFSLRFCKFGLKACRYNGRDLRYPPILKVDK